MTVDAIEIRRPDDFHLHVRHGEMLAAVLPATAAHFARGLLMPNTVPPIADAHALIEYRAAVEAQQMPGFTPLMTIRVNEETDDKTIRLAAEAGAVAGKLYPRGATTNSADGVRDVDALLPALAAMADAGMVLCVHPEQPDAFSLDREATFITEVLPTIIAECPQLRIVLEHVSTAAAVDWVRQQRSTPRSTTVAATITAHHLVLTLDDVVGDLLEPHNFCKPLAKRSEDRAALIAAATSGDPAFFLGTDSAPHDRAAKECAHGCAGVFTAPVALPVLAQVFDNAGALDRLEAFTSVAGANFYGLPLNTGTVRLSRHAWRVPKQYGSVVPFMAGQMLAWMVSAVNVGG